MSGLPRSSFCTKQEIRLVSQNDEVARIYIEHQLDIRVTDPFIGLLVEHAGEVVGAVILNDYTPGQNIELTMHACGNCSIKDIRDIARYCFDRVRRITARTSVRNTRAMRMLTMLGFKREGILREWFMDSGDAIVFGLLKSEQKISRA
jgi:hypothetical protein